MAELHNYLFCYPTILGFVWLALLATRKSSTYTMGIVRIGLIKGVDTIVVVLSLNGNRCESTPISGECSFVVCL